MAYLLRSCGPPKNGIRWYAVEKIEARLREVQMILDGTGWHAPKKLSGEHL
jgi:hypothetical protein